MDAYNSTLKISRFYLEIKDGIWNRVSFHLVHSSYMAIRQLGNAKRYGSIYVHTRRNFQVFL